MQQRVTVLRIPTHHLPNATRDAVVTATLDDDSDKHYTVVERNLVDDGLLSELLLVERK